jgi:hypothetical protein
MKLWIVKDKILIDAPSTDDRLTGIPGYGWQPTPGAWEFPNHNGVIALARRILGTDVSISENLENNAVIWAAKVEALETSDSVPVRIEQNRYLVDHGHDDNYRAELIPSCEMTPTGSKFLIHPAIIDLVYRVFGGFRRDVTDIADTGDEPGESPATLDCVDCVVSGKETVAGEADDLNRSLLPDENAGTESWIIQVLKILQAAALGNHPSARDVEAATADPINASVLRLAGLMADRKAESVRRESCCDLVGRLSWDARYYLLFELSDNPLDYTGSEHVDDVAFIKDCVAGLIGVERFEEMAKVTDILDVCGTDLAHRKAMDAYLDDLLIENPESTPTPEPRVFLKRILDWFSGRIDENALDRAFDAYGMFLSRLARPEDLDELLDVCSGVGDRRVLKSKSILLAAHSIHAMSAPDGGIDKAIEFLVETQRSLPPDYDDQEYICSEARILAGKNSDLVNLLGDCGHSETEPESEENPVRGSLLVIGGTQRTKRIGVRALESRFPNVNVSWLHTGEARTDRIRTTIMNSDRKIVLYTWVMSHSMEGAARSAASSADASWERVRLPAITDVIRVAARLLGVGK